MQMTGQADHRKGVVAVVMVQAIAQGQHGDLVTALGQGSGELRHIGGWAADVGREDAGDEEQAHPCHGC